MEIKEIMNVLKFKVLVILVSLSFSAFAEKDYCEDLNSLWVMTQMTPVHPQSSNPRGAVNSRWFFDSKDLKVYTSFPDDVDGTKNDEKKAIPYQCENIDHQFELISKCMDEKGVCYIGLTYFNFDKQIDYATRIDLAISHRPPFMSVYNQSCFKKPYFSIKDRCLRLLDTVSRRQLINLKIAYV